MLLTIENDRNPKFNQQLNPRLNNELNPLMNVDLNPKLNAFHCPSRNHDINPMLNLGINPKYNEDLDVHVNPKLSPKMNAEIDPKRNDAINPRKGADHSGFFAYDLMANPTHFVLEVAEGVVILFDLELVEEMIGVATSNGGYALFATATNDWVGHLVPDGYDGFLRFDRKDEWLGFAC